MASVELKNVKISTVKPFETSEHPTILAPSMFDLPGYLDAYISTLFVYKPENGKVDESATLLFVDTLKESLSKVLVPFFPFAGRWVKTYDARIRELECTDEGVTLIEAHIDKEMDAVINLENFEPREILRGFKYMGLDSSVFNQHVDLPLPSVFVQVTTFKSGEIALNVSICHQTADGEGMFSFMKAWSQIALHGETSIIPVHDRSLTTSLGAFMESVGAPTPPAAQEGESKLDPGAGLKVRLEPMSFKSLHVRRQAIDELKAQAAEEGLEVTTVDLITSHIWRSVNNFPETLDNRTSTLVSTWVDGRKRMHSPPLPDTYSGNAIVLAYPPVIPAAILSSYSHLEAASIIHDALRAVTPSSWKSLVLFTMSFLFKLSEAESRQMMVTSWFRFPMYEISFGCGFGRPVYATANGTGRFVPVGLVTILPPPPGRSKDTIATLQLCVQENNGAAQALFSDQSFLHFFHS